MSKKIKKSRAIIEDDDDDEDEIIDRFEKSTKKLDFVNDQDENEEDEEEGDEAEEEDDDDEEEDEDEEAQPEEFNDFIADEDEEEEQEEAGDNASESSSIHKSKKRKKDKKKKKKKSQVISDGDESKSSSSNQSLSELSDDDLDLIKSNLNVDDLEEVGIKKRKRRIEVRSESSDEERRSERGAERSERKKSKQSEKNAHNEKDEDEEAAGAAAGSDDEGSFIVDDTDDENEHDSRADRAHTSQKHKRLYTDDAQQEALDIFGVNADELGAASDDEPNEDDDDEQDYNEEEDDDQDQDEETYDKAAKKRHRLKTMHKIEDIFEPQELEKNLLTELDQQIRLEDKPERFMLRQVPVSSEPDELELEKEAEWIHNAAFYSTSEKKAEPIIARIKEVLNFIRNELFEVPFIAQYRKEHYEPELDLNALWKVYEMDEKYCQLKTRKQNLYRLLERMQAYLSSDDESKSRTSRRPLTHLDLERVKNIQTIDEFLDCYHHFHLHYNSDLAPMKQFEINESVRARLEARRADLDMENIEDNLDEEDLQANLTTFTKHASKRDAFNYCKQMGIGQLAARFGLSAENYAQNLHADYTKHDIDQEQIEPEQLAKEYLNEPFESVQQILTMCRYMLSIEFAREPSIRAYFRDLYNQRVCMSVRATVPRGLNEIDENHPLYHLKYVKMKPVRDIKHDEYLKLCQAEKDGLLIVKFECDNGELVGDANGLDGVNSGVNSGASGSIIDKLKSFYQKDEFSYNVEQWNKQRAMIVEDMCFKLLMPDMERETRSRLASEAKQYVFNQCADKLETMLNTAPYNPTIESIDDEEDRLRVLAISYAQNDQDNNQDSAYCCACVNTDGMLNEHIYLNRLHVRSGTTRSRDLNHTNNGIEQKEKMDEMSKLESFIESKRPKVIVIAAENKNALFIQEQLTDLVKNKLGMAINVELVDNQVAQLCQASKMCQQEFSASIAPLVRSAIYLARYIQDPLLCISQLCNQDRDILGLNLHPMMQYIISASGSRTSDDSSQLLKQLEIKFINVVNDVGVDLNRCDVEPHTSGVLQFVCGLGPRKAAHILKVLRAGRLDLKGKLTNKELSTYPVFPNRLCLVTKCSLGRKVFINCSGFIKLDVDKISKEIDEDDDENQDEANYTDPLDSTRIHLESYEWAKKIAIDALDLDENSEAANSRTALKEILENPRRLKDLDLDAFADELMRTGYGNKITTLYDIRQELSYRYRDRRVPYTPIDPVQRFYTLINETPDTFNKGSCFFFWLFFSLNPHPV